MNFEIGREGRRGEKGEGGGEGGRGRKTGSIGARGISSRASNTVKESNKTVLLGLQCSRLY